MLNILVIVLFIVCNVVAEDGDAESRVINGNVAAEDQFAYQVSITSNNILVCSGTIVHTSWILTVAHCLYKQPPNPVFAYVGSNNLTTGGILYSVDRQILHENWSLLTFQHDIMLLHLTRPVLLINNRAAIGIMTRKPVPDGAILTMAGWGSRMIAGPYSEQLIVITQVKINQTECSRLGLPSHSTNFCTYAARGTGFCSGDSGSPCFYQNRIVGLASYSYRCATSAPDVFTDLTQYVDWVQNTIKENERNTI